jgi:two-component system cell cycle sensor histidine kinase/response regulator CckA
MVMPEGLSGRELAERLRMDRPALKVMYCSGYTDDVLGSDSPLRNEQNFLEKPFEVGKFLQRVRNCLDGN